MNKILVGLSALVVFGATACTPQEIAAVVASVAEPQAPAVRSNPTYTITHHDGDPIVTECPAGESLAGVIAYCLPDGFDGVEVDGGPLVTVIADTVVTECPVTEHLVADVCIPD